MLNLNANAKTVSYAMAAWGGDSSNSLLKMMLPMSPVISLILW